MNSEDYFKFDIIGLMENDRKERRKEQVKEELNILRNAYVEQHNKNMVSLKKNNKAIA